MCLPVRLEKEMQMVVSYQMGVGTKPRSSARAQELQVLSADESFLQPLSFLFVEKIHFRVLHSYLLIGKGF